MQFLWVLYPVLVHSAVVTGSTWLQAAAISFLLLLCLIVPLRRRRLWAAPALLIGSAASLWFCRSGWGMYFLYLPPLLMHGFMGMIFLHSLQAGRRAMISVVAEKIRRETLPPELEHYTRQMTKFWTALFFGMAILGVLLAIFASHEAWSLFTNVISYLLVGLVFLLEFGLRRVLYPQFRHVSVKEYLSGLVRTDFRRL